MDPTYFNTNITFPYNIYNTQLPSGINFGGEEYGMFDVSTLTWTSNDIPNIYANLQKFNIPDPKFELYEFNKIGTQTLIADLILKQHPVAYILICIIYHQLHYQEPLEANFSTGMPLNNDDTNTEEDDNIIT